MVEMKLLGARPEGNEDAEIIQNSIHAILVIIFIETQTLISWKQHFLFTMWLFFNDFKLGILLSYLKISDHYNSFFLVEGEIMISSSRLFNLYTFWSRFVTFKSMAIGWVLV